MMNSQWTAQDVERFREQQRWRLRQKTGVQSAPPARLPDNQTETHERQRKVSLRFRREHQQFVAKEMDQPSQPPHLRAMEVTMRPTFSVVLPSTRQRRPAESPLPHIAHSMFNAFDSTASPEVFEFERQSNQVEHSPKNSPLRSPLRADHNEDQDTAMSDGDDHDHINNGHDESLWRRRFHVHGMAKRSPKLGRVALWESGTPSCVGNQLMEAARMPHPFASEDDL